MVQDVNKIWAHLCGIVQCTKSWRERNVAKRYNFWLFPPSISVPVTEQHVVGEVLSERDLRWTLDLFVDLWARLLCHCHLYTFMLDGEREKRRLELGHEKSRALSQSQT